MIVVVFQVAAMAGSASPEPVLDEEILDLDFQDVDATDWNGPIEKPEPQVLTDSTVPGSGVESHRSGEYSVFSEAVEVVAAPVLSQGGDTISVRANSGTYVLNLAHPESVSLQDHNGVALVSDSYFVIKSPSITTVPLNGAIVKASNDMIILEYDLADPDGAGAVQGRMQVTIDFSRMQSPKITANLVQVDPDLADWQIAWVIVPAEGSKIVRQGASDADALPIANLPDCRMPTAGMSIQLLDSCENRYSVDWSDAGCGVLAIRTVKMGAEDSVRVLEIVFDTGKAEIDPTLVATTSGTTPTEHSPQRKVVNYGGYYWAFYYTGSTICYKKSVDGITWGSQVSLPGGTTITVDDTGASTGFDVYQRDGTIALVWEQRTDTYPYLHLYFIKGTILSGKIAWSDKHEVYSPNHVSSPAVSIGTDGKFWIAALSRLSPAQQYYIWYSTTGTSWSVAASHGTYRGSVSHWFTLMPYSNGRMTLLATWYADGGTSDKYAYVTNGTWDEWKAPRLVSTLNIQPVAKGPIISAVATMDGVIHTVFKDALYSGLKYAKITTTSQYTYQITTSAINGYPTICLDANGDLHAYYIAIESSIYKIKHSMRWGLNYNEWTTPDVFYTASSGVTVKGLTSWAYSLSSNAMLWTESSTQVKFGSIPLPYGTPGASADPWNRDGISPYATYFSTFGDMVSPGSGLLNMLHTDVSIESRGAPAFEATRIYQQPRYFTTSNGLPYQAGAYPYCDLGPGWSLDLPWMDSQYVYVGGGQRFVINWGSTGVVSEFENHDGVHFFMHGFTHNYQYYELVMSDGLRYIFLASSKKLVSISDSQGYVSSNPLYGENTISVWYDPVTGYLQKLRDPAYRDITFSYNANNLLQTITRPDGETVGFGYSSIGGYYRLTSVTDEKLRSTSYGYTGYGSPACYLLTSVTFPTGGRNEYTYTQDASVGTEVKSYLVTTQRTEDASTGNLIRQTDYIYKTVNGRVVFVTVTQRDANNVVKGCTDYIFSSGLKQTSEITRGADGVQMQRTDTWYNMMGQPARVDTYEGFDAAPSYSEYTGYDDWGNVIFTRNAMGYESYVSYANTKTENSFQGGTILKRTGSGRLLYDAFDDWDFSDWATSLASGNSVTIDATVTGSGNSPAVKVTRTAVGDASFSHSIAAQSQDFIIQTKFMVSSTYRSYVLGMSDGGAGTRVYFWAESGDFSWYDSAGEHIIENVDCVTNQWYDLGFYVHPGTNKYDIYIDGTLRYTGANLYGTSGSIDLLRFQPYFSATVTASIWVDDVRIYRSLTVTVSGASGYALELFDSNGDMLDRSTTGTLTIPAMPLHFPPGYIRMSKVGFQTFETAMMDIWGGDAYSLSSGESRSSLPKTTTGFNRNTYSTTDDEYPSGSTTIYSGDSYDPWITDTDYVMSGSKYHESRNTAGCHYHGWYNVNTFMVYDTTSVLTVYAWLTEGKVPREIMLQFRISTTWFRAYWGGDAYGVDMMSTGTYAPSYTVRMGDVPQTTDQWLQLAVKASDLGLTFDGYLTGVIYGVYDMTARWDITGRAYSYIQVGGLQSGMTVNFESDDDVSVSGTASSTTVNLDLVGAGVNVFPISGTIEVLSGSDLLYTAPWIQQVYNYDVYTYSAPSFYANDATGFVHNRAVGSFQYQDSSKTVKQESYFKLDAYGNMMESKAGSGSTWYYSQMGYDRYGNPLWSADQTGRGSMKEYSIADYNTYPKSSRTGHRFDTFDTDDSWTSSTSADWMSCTYSDAMSYSGDESIKAWFSGGPQGSDTAGASSYKEYSYVQPIQELSVWMYLDSWYHDAIWTNYLDTGIRMRLYDSSNNNYATYTYWLACWYYTSNNRSAPDQYTKVVYGIGDLPMDTWKNIVVHPSTDWPTINWGSCAKIRYELYVYSSYAYQDYLTLYYDNFAHNDIAKNAVTTYTYQKSTGLLLSSTDPLGRTTSQQYDVLGRVIRVNNSDLVSYRRMVYDDTLNKVTLYDELNHKWINYYDKVGRLTRAERCGLLSSSYYSYETYTYGWDDNVLSYRNPRGYTTDYEYDFLGRLTKTTNHDDTYSTVTYLDHISTNLYIDENGHQTDMAYDDLGRHALTREYYTSGSYYLSSMSYDAVGNLKSVTDANTKQTTMTYDSFNRLTRIDYPDGYYETASYDAAGRVTSKVNRAGQTTTTAYNTAGLVAKVSSTGDTITMTYNAAGQVLTNANSAGTITYQYDNMGRVQSQSQTISGTNYAMSFGYDLEGKTTSITYPNSVVINYQYDSYDRVQYVKQGTTTLVTISYNTDDTVYRETTSAGQETTYIYTNRGWVDTIVMKIGTKTKMSLDYGYDNVGNVLSIGTESYTYDYLNRLKTANGPWGSLAYTYDPVGNRIGKTDDGASTTYAFDSYNKLTSDTAGYTYGYDANGNMNDWYKASSFNLNINYNSLNQMTSYYEYVYNVRKSTWDLVNSQTYSYDANGARVKLYTSEGSSTTYFVYIGHDVYYEKTGTLATDHVYANGRMVAKIAGSDVYFYISDALGGTRQVWKLGLTTKAYATIGSYEPFGIPYNAKGAESVLFAGEIYNTESEMYYIGARYMAPSLGRWMSLDPELGKLSSPQTLNRYVYCANNPLRFIDPTGEGFFDFLDNKWVQIAIVCIVVTVLVVATAGIAAPIIATSVLGMTATAAASAGTAAAISAGIGAGLSMGAVAMTKGTSASLAEYAGAGIAGGIAGMFGPLGSAAAKGGMLLRWAGMALSAGFGSEGASWGLSNLAGEGRSFDLGNAAVGTFTAGLMSKLNAVHKNPGKYLFKKVTGLFGRPYSGQGAPIKYIETYLTPWAHTKASFEMTGMIASAFIGIYVKTAVAQYTN